MTEPDPKSEAEQASETPSRKRAVARGTSLRRPAGEQAAAADSAGEAEVSLSKGAPTAQPETAKTDDTKTEAASGGSDTRTTYALVAAAAVIAVAAAVVAIVRPAAGPVSNEAYVNTALTTQIVSTAKQAAKDIYTIDMNDIGPWEQRMNAVLTAGMVDEAKKLRAGILQASGQLQDVTIKVDDPDLTAGVALATTDHAEVLLNIRQQVAEKGVPRATMQAPMKFVLDRFDGAWKVSSITQL